MRTWIRNASFLFVIGASLRSLGLLGRDLYQLLSLLGFLVFVSTFLSATAVRRRPALLDAFLCGACVALAIGVGRLADLGLLHFYLLLLIALVVWFRQSDTADLRQLASYTVAFACVAILSELVRVIPYLWHAWRGAASMLSTIAGALAREDRNLGPTAMALPLLAALMILWLVRETLSESRRPRRWLYGALVLMAAHLSYLVMLTFYARWVSSHAGREWFILNSQHVFLVLGSGVFTLADRGRRMRAILPVASRRVGYASLAALATGLAATAFLGWAPPPPRSPATVMIYDAGYVNWEVPVYGKYGEGSAGMFGMLPAALEASGLEVVVSDDLGRLDAPEPPDCLVMINIQKFLDAPDKERIWRFVSGGGGLLCLGDHTGVAGIRGPFNDLLEPVGIRFEFDSSTFFGRGWEDALEYRVHPVNRGVESDEDYQIWVGATLDLDAGARPVVVGRYGYSDIGDPANIDRAYLGDRRYNPDELLGDVVLVADAKYGKGKVMVFGDTSGFQNLSFARSLDTVARSLFYLAREGGWGRGGLGQIVGLFCVVLVGLGAAWFAGTPVPLVALALGLGVGSAGVGAATPAPPSITPVFAEKNPRFLVSSELGRPWRLAVLDVSHGGRHTLRAWKDRSVGGFQLNLARNGFFPVIRDRFPYRDLDGGAKLLVLLAPTRRYSGAEVDAVERFVADGGRVIACVGFEELSASRGLLGRFGLDVAGIPLGRVEIPVEGDTLSVVVKEGWPVRFDATVPAEVLLSAWDYPVAVERSIGKGEVVLIGDTSFFHDANLETLDHYFAGNVEFLRRLTTDDRRPPR
jgi:hypothetical protein